MSAAPAGEWVHLASAFLAGHVDDNGKRLAFTACFNPALESLILEEAVPLEWRFLLWLYRQSWGNYSDFAVRDKGDKVPLGQKDAAADLGTEKQRISEIVAYWRGLGYLSLGTARRLVPADSGVKPEKVRHVADFHSPNFRLEFRAWWKVRNVADFEAWEVHRAEYFRLVKVHAAAVKEFEASRTTGGPILIEEESKNIKESSSATLHSENATTTSPEPDPAAAFQTQHVEVWLAAGKNTVPTRKQSDEVLRAVGVRAEEFLRWMAQKLQRVRHPGALPKLVEEFLQTAAEPPPMPAPKCWKCGGSLENGSVDGACFACIDVPAAVPT